MSTTLEQRLQVVEDIEAIRVLKADYCAGCDDDHNPDTLTSLFVPDGVWHAVPGIARCEGHEQIHAFFKGLRDSGRMRNTAHNVFNPRIRVQGDEATGHWRLLMLYTANEPDGGVSYQRIIGWYDEHYVRTPAGWRYRSLFCQVEESGPYQMADLQADTAGGSR